MKRGHRRDGCVGVDAVGALLGVFAHDADPQVRSFMLMCSPGAAPLTRRTRPRVVRCAPTGELARAFASIPAAIRQLQPHLRMVLRDATNHQVRSLGA